MSDFYRELRTSIDRGCERCRERVKVFFRADDVGVPSPTFTRMMDLFIAYRLPLALALVPAWLTDTRWEYFRSVSDTRPELWCWHQHGWRHANHQSAGRKSEFGPDRTEDGIRSDLRRGRDRLKKIVGNGCCPVFTPPWNRCDRRTLDILKELGFLAVSRSVGGYPESPARLTDIPMHIDLHTRKGTDPAADRALLLYEIENAFTQGCCGVMIHHRLMTGAAFEFLDALLGILSKHTRVAPVGFQEMV
jgi:peptidoglycan/xylan/chitin deacetylase (PgdA/CDA1 family)